MVQPQDEEQACRERFLSLELDGILGHQHWPGSRLAPGGRTRHHPWQTTTHLGSFQLQHHVAKEHPNDHATLRHVL